MSAINRIFISALTCLLAPLATAIGQTPSASPTHDTTPVFRVNTELVQTEVMVFDKGGRFVVGLRPEDFELRIDGKVNPVAFFERIAAGNANEAAQLTGR